MAAADFKGDGRADIAIQNPAAYFRIPQEAGVSETAPYFMPYKRYGAPEVVWDDFFHPSPALCSFMTWAYSAIAAHASIAVGDIDGNDKVDLVITGGEHGVRVLMGRGNGQFRDEGNSLIDNLRRYYNAAILADLNADSRPELITAEPYGVSVRPNVGGRFGEFSAYVNGKFHSLAAGDFNGDGFLDIAAAGTTEVRILLGNGAGGLTVAGSFASGISARENGVLAAADFNGDGTTDLAVLTADGNVTYLFGGAATTTSTLSTTAGATVVYGTALPLKLQIGPSGMGFNEPSGTVTFFDGATKLGEITQTTSTFQFTAANLALESTSSPPLTRETPEAEGLPATRSRLKWS